MLRKSNCITISAVLLTNSLIVPAAKLTIEAETKDAETGIIQLPENFSLEDELSDLPAWEEKENLPEKVTTPIIEEKQEWVETTEEVSEETGYWVTEQITPDEVVYSADTTEADEEQSEIEQLLKESEDLKKRADVLQEQWNRINVATVDEEPEPEETENAAEESQAEESDSEKETEDLNDLTEDPKEDQSESESKEEDATLPDIPEESERYPKSRTLKRRD